MQTGQQIYQGRDPPLAERSLCVWDFIYTQYPDKWLFNSFKRIKLTTIYVPAFHPNATGNSHSATSEGGDGKNSSVFCSPAGDLDKPVTS